MGGFRSDSRDLHGRALDLNDPRDAQVVHRHIRERLAVNIHLSFLTVQIEVVLLNYESKATCDSKQPRFVALDFDEWLESHGPIEPRRLGWMKPETLLAELISSCRVYAKNIMNDMEGAVSLVADRLKNNELLENSRTP